MKTKTYSFARFYDAAKVQDALAVLLSAGFPRDHIRVLAPTEAAQRNSVNNPDVKRLALRGAWMGFVIGAILGAIIFVAPSFIWEYRYENMLAVVGMIIFLGVGTVVGILQALMLMRRQSGDHVIGPNEHGVFVKIEDGEEQKLERAKVAYDQQS